MEHFPLGGSNAHRWIRCPASLRAEQGLPDVETPEAREGSLAHWLLEQCLLTGREPGEFVGEAPEEFAPFAVDDEMARHIEGVVGRAQLKAKGGILMAETEVDFSPWVIPGAFGTSDIIIVLPQERRLVVIDLKYGRGVQVFAEGNEQIRLYALGAYNMLECVYDLESAELIIDQPRLGHYDSETLDLGELLAFGDTAKAAAEVAVGDDPHFGPGSKPCLFCKAKATCNPLAEYLSQLIDDDFDIVEDDPAAAADPAQLSPERLATLLSHEDMIAKWLAAVREHAHRTLRSGGTIPGFKLVKGRSNRAWKDAAEAEAELRKRLKVGDVFNQKLISPTQAEEKLSDRQYKAIKHLVIKPDGKLSLVPASDKRAAISFDVDDDFEVIDAEE